MLGFDVTFIGSNRREESHAPFLPMPWFRQKWGCRLLREWAVSLTMRRAVRTLTIRRNGSRRILTWGRRGRSARVPLCSQLIFSCGCLFAPKDSPADGKPRFIFLRPARNFLCRFSFACLHVCAHARARMRIRTIYAHVRADDVDGEWYIYLYISSLFLVPQIPKKCPFLRKE